MSPYIYGCVAQRSQFSKEIENCECKRMCCCHNTSINIAPKKIPNVLHSFHSLSHSLSVFTRLNTFDVTEYIGCLWSLVLFLLYLWFHLLKNLFIFFFRSRKVAIHRIVSFLEVIYLLDSRRGDHSTVCVLCVLLSRPLPIVQSKRFEFFFLLSIFRFREIIFASIAGFHGDGGDVGDGAAFSCWFYFFSFTYLLCASLRLLPSMFTFLVCRRWIEPHASEHDVFVDFIFILPQSPRQSRISLSLSRLLLGSVQCCALPIWIYRYCVWMLGLRCRVSRMPIPFHTHGGMAAHVETTMCCIANHTCSLIWMFSCETVRCYYGWLWFFL